MSQRGKTRLDELLIAALLPGSTVAAAARKCGISARTAQRRMADADFQAKFRDAKLRLVRSTTARLTANSGRAAEVLRKIFDDRQATAGARVSAASQTIKLTLDSFELEELEERIRRLEEMQHNVSPL